MATTTTPRTARTSAKAKATTEQAKATGRQAERTLHSALTDVGYAALGVGGSTVDLVRSVGRTSAKLPAVLLDAPETVTSVLNSTATTLSDGYSTLVSRGRTLTGQIADEPAVKDATNKVSKTAHQAKSTIGQARSAGKTTAKKATSQAKRASTSVTKAAKATTAEATKQAERAAGDVADAAASTANTAKAQAKQTTGQAKATGKAASEAADSASKATSAATKVTPKSESDTGTGPLDSRTVEQLGNRAAELDITGRSSMTKDELVAAIRDAS